MAYDLLESCFLSLNALSVYRSILKDKAVSRLQKLLGYVLRDNTDLNAAVSLYCDFYNALTSSGGAGSLKEHIVDRVLGDENPFTLHCELSGGNTPFDEAAALDLFHLQRVARLPSALVKERIRKGCSPDQASLEVLNSLPGWESFSMLPVDPSLPYGRIKNTLMGSESWKDCLLQLSMFHRQNGSGIFALYRAFVWESDGKHGFLRGIDNPDPVSLSDLVGYNDQKAAVLENTLALVKDLPCNNILLYGDRGTGKSSTVKAVANELYHKGLRLVEVQKRNLFDFPKLVNLLRGRGLKFIVFIDDLAFVENEENFTSLKGVLEGSVEMRPGNVVIYATSNRKHLIKETFAERSGLYSSDPEMEVRASDTLQEKLSFSDRFGITLVFPSPGKDMYLEIVDTLAERRKLKVDREFLHKEALKWELSFNGRSPRTARQFIDWLEGRMKKA